MEEIEITINPKLYPLETIYSASYVFLDKAYIKLEGDPNTEVVVKLKSKDGSDLEKLRGDFLNELINYADYNHRAKKTKEIREMLLQRAIITNDPSVLEDKEDIKEEDEGDSEIDDEEFEKLMKELEDEDDEEFDDPEGIAIPWEEKYGKETDDCKNKDHDEKMKIEKDINNESEEDFEEIKLPWEENDSEKDDEIYDRDDKIDSEETDVQSDENIKKNDQTQDPKMTNSESRVPSIDELRRRR